MANRTTIERVRAIMAEMEVIDADVTSYIGAANTFVTARLGTSSLGDTLLEEIERWVTAHMIAATRERLAQTEGAGGASATYIGEYSTQLSSTPYGQMAMMLDTSGVLASTSGMKQPWLKSINSNNE